MDKKKVFTYILISLNIIVLLLGSVWLAKEKEVKYIEKETIKEIYLDSDGKVNENFSKEEAAEFVKAMLTEFQKDPKGRTAKERIKVLDDGGSITEVVTEDAMEFLHLADAFENDPAGKDIAGISLLTVIRLIEEINDGKIEILISNYSEAIYLDSTARLSYVPLDLFIGQLTGFSFEISYIDGEWKYIPYNLIESIKLSDMISNR